MLRLTTRLQELPSPIAAIDYDIREIESAIERGNLAFRADQAIGRKASNCQRETGTHVHCLTGTQEQTLSQEQYVVGTELATQLQVHLAPAGSGVPHGIVWVTQRPFESRSLYSLTSPGLCLSGFGRVAGSERQVTDPASVNDQSRIVKSSAPEASRLLSWLNATDLTAPEWPERILAAVPTFLAQRLML
jgi:hypothetical protein